MVWKERFLNTHTQVTLPLGATVKDQNIFRELAAKYEEEFLEDMRRLGVRPPHVLTRVTEYMPEILEYAFPPSLPSRRERQRLCCDLVSFRTYK